MVCIPMPCVHILLFIVDGSHPPTLDELRNRSPSKRVSICITCTVELEFFYISLIVTSRWASIGNILGKL